MNCESELKMVEARLGRQLCHMEAEVQKALQRYHAAHAKYINVVNWFVRQLKQLDAAVQSVVYERSLIHNELQDVQIAQAAQSYDPTTVFT